MTTNEKLEKIGYTKVNKSLVSVLLGSSITSINRRFPKSIGLCGMQLTAETPFNEKYDLIVGTDTDTGAFRRTG